MFYDTSTMLGRTQIFKRLGANKRWVPEFAFDLLCSITQFTMMFKANVATVMINTVKVERGCNFAKTLTRNRRPSYSQWSTPIVCNK